MLNKHFLRDLIIQLYFWLPLSLTSFKIKYNGVCWLFSFSPRKYKWFHSMSNLTYSTQLHPPLKGESSPSLPAWTHCMCKVSSWVGGLGQHLIFSLPPPSVLTPLGLRARRELRKGSQGSSHLMVIA